MNLKLYSLLSIALIISSTFIYGQGGAYVISENEEFEVTIPSDEVYYDSHYKDGWLLYEELFNDDFELDVSIYEDDSFEFFDDLSEFCLEMADDLGYRNARFFSKREIRSGINAHFYYAYSSDDDCNVIFGVVQDSFARKQYEIELFCFNIDSRTASSIIKSININ